MIQNDEELARVLADVNRGIQDVTDYLNDNGRNDAHLLFPAGVLRTCDQHRADFAFIANESLKSNIAYTLMTYGVLVWMHNRTSLTPQPKSMLLKICIILITSIIESLVHNQQRGLVWPRNERVSFRRRVRRLITDGVIDEELAGNLNWVWDRRQSVHLYQVEEREYLEYRPEDVIRSRAVCDALRTTLAQRN